MLPKHIQYILTSILLILAGCNVQVSNESEGTAAPFIITSTLPASLTPQPSETLPPPPPQPTVSPAEGTASTQINVRAEPSTASEVLGVIAANTRVEIVGRDPGGNWWQIIYPAGNEGKGWVTAQYVTTTSQPEVPVIGGDESSAVGENSAVIIQQLNVRSGPGTDFDSLGVLNANDVVTLTGKNSGASWLQIAFAEGPEGRGWVNAAFIKTNDVEGLPIVSDVGEVIGTGTPADTPPPPTPTVVPASMDFDSAETPIKTILLEEAGTHTVLYNGDVSSPDGDTDDWVSVIPYNDVIFAGIQCRGSVSIHAEVVGTAISLTCNEGIKAVPVQVSAGLLIHIKAAASTDQLLYTNYTLTIQASP